MSKTSTKASTKHNIKSVLRQAFSGRDDFEYICVGVARQRLPNGTAATVFFGADDEKGVTPLSMDGLRWAMVTIGSAAAQFSQSVLEPDLVDYHEPEGEDSDMPLMDDVLARHTGGYNA